MLSAEKSLEAKQELWRPGQLSYPLLGLFALILLWDTSAQIFLKLGLAAHGEFPLQGVEPAIAYLRAIVKEPLIWMGVLALVLAFLTWLAILARVELSKAHPATSCSYITVTIASCLFLHEPLGVLKLSGILLIMLGVYLVAE